MKLKSLERKQKGIIMREYSVEELNIIRDRAVDDGYKLTRSPSGYRNIAIAGGTRAKKYRVYFNRGSKHYDYTYDSLKRALNKRNALYKELGIPNILGSAIDICDLPNADKYLASANKDTAKIKPVSKKDTDRKVIKVYGYEGETHKGNKFLSFFNGNYFVLSDGKVHITSLADYIATHNLRLMLDLSINPCLHYTDSTTEIYTIDGKYFIIDTCMYDKLKDSVWQYADGKFISKDGLDLEIALGVDLNSVEFKNGCDYDFRKDNLVSKKEEVVKEEPKHLITVKQYGNRELCKLPYYVNQDDLVKEPYSLTGMQVDNYLIISPYKGSQYFARKKTDEGYEIVLVSAFCGVLTEHKLELSVIVPAFTFKDGYSVIFSKDGYPVIIETEYLSKVKSMFKYRDGDFYYCASDVLLVKDLYDVPAVSDIIYKDGLKYNLRLSNLVFNPLVVSEKKRNGVYWDESKKLYFVRVFNDGKLRYEKGFENRNAANTRLRKAVQLYG